MKEYCRHIEEYSSKAYFTCSSLLESEWGNKEAAEEYLEKFWLPKGEYEGFWKSIQNQIFINQQKGLPEFVFSGKYKVIALRGGVVFAEEDFHLLQKCFLDIGDKNFVIIENTFGSETQVPAFRMKYPTSISWNELMSGNFISSVLFETPNGEYFVFGDSGGWGKYAANDYEYPLDIIGFKPEHASIFKENFEMPEAEHQEIMEWLPQAYRNFYTP